MSDPIGMGFKLDCLKKPYFGGRLGTYSCQRPQPFRMSLKSPALAGGDELPGDVGVGGGWGMWHSASFQGTGSRVLAKPSMGQAGNVLWGEALLGAGRDAPGMLLPCSCGVWLLRGQAVSPGHPSVPKRQNSRTISQGA